MFIPYGNEVPANVESMVACGFAGFRFRRTRPYSLSTIHHDIMWNNGTLVWLGGV